MAFLRCPYCRKVLPSGTWGDPAGRWGSPFVKCPQCGKDCVDATKTEPALKKLEMPDLSVGHLVKVHFFPFGLLALFCLFAAWRSPENTVLFLSFAGGFIGVYAYRVWQDARSRERVHERMRRLYAESEERLKDPKYIRALVSLDYDVPMSLREYADSFPEDEGSEDTDEN